MRPNTSESHGVTVDMGIFARGVAFPSSPYSPAAKVDTSNCVQAWLQHPMLSPVSKGDYPWGGYGLKQTPPDSTLSMQRDGKPIQAKSQQMCVSSQLFRDSLQPASRQVLDT
jgi:hypothetical protein